MSTDVSFRVTVEYDCDYMVSKEDLKNDFNNNPMEAYKYISNGFEDSPINFSQKERVVKVEIIPNQK